MITNKRIFITGGAGYCGSVLVPQLLNKGYAVTVFDKLYYGKQFLPLKNPNLNVIEGDIRDAEFLAASIPEHDIVLHLACISNDASFVLDERLSTTVNLDAFEPLVKIAKENGVNRFIYASSSSVYGISDAKDVTEDHPLVPLTLYNKYKGMCEPLLFKYSDKSFETVVFRPATVCGYAPRQRLDLTVNILTNLAINKRKITVFGGEQLRPNLHIQDYVDLCLSLITADSEKIQRQTFNCGYQNMSVAEIALSVKRIVLQEFPNITDIDVETTPSDDNRSYHINSDKIKNILGFEPQYSVDDAVRDLCKAFSEGLLPNTFDDDIYYNVRTMQALGSK